MLDRLLRRGKANSDRGLCRHCFQSFERQQQVRAAFVVGNRVDFVDDHRFDVAQNAPALFGSQQDVERFGCSNSAPRLRAGAGLGHFLHRGGHIVVPFGLKRGNWAPIQILVLHG